MPPKKTIDKAAEPKKKAKINRRVVRAGAGETLSTDIIVGPHDHVTVDFGGKGTLNIKTLTLRGGTLQVLGKPVNVALSAVVAK